MRRSATLAVAAIGAALSGWAQTAPPPQTQQPPAFRASTDVVVVDVAVIGRDGPVKDLQAADFTVRVDGQPRRVVSMQFIEEPAAARPAAGAPTTTATANLSRASSNEAEGGGRLVVLLVDQDSIPFGQLRVAAESAGQLLAALGPSDRVALATLPGPRIVVNFDADRQRIVEALRAIPGSATPRHQADEFEIGYAEAFRLERGDESILRTLVERECAQAAVGVRDPDRAIEQCRQRVQIQARQIVIEARQQTSRFAAGLRALLSTLGGIDAPKLLVVMSTGLVAPDAANDLAFVARASASARTSIYAVRLDPAMFDVSRRRAPGSPLDDRELALSGLEAVAGRARGTLVEVSGGAQVPFARLARDMSGYYLLGIETTSADRDGRAHRIAVETARSGLTVRARPEFVFAPADEPATRGGNEMDVVARTLSSPLPAAAVPLRVATFNLADDDPATVRVMIVAEIDRDQPGGETLAVGYTLADAQGNPIGQFSRRLPLERMPSGALAFVTTVSLRPGRYLLKVAAAHGDRAGSVERRFTAGMISAGPIRLGELVIGDPLEAQGKMIAPPVEPRLRGERIWAFVQIGADPAVLRDARLAMDILKTEGGEVLLSAPLELVQASGRLRVGQADIDGRPLPPGDYVARVRAEAAGRAVGTVSAPFAFERGRAPGSARPAASRETAPFDVREVLDPGVATAFLADREANWSEADRAAMESVKAGRYAEAAQKLGNAGSTDAVAPFIRGLALLADRQPDPAAVAFRQAVAAAPDFLAGAFYIGSCYAVGGKPQQAIAAWQTSLTGLERHAIVYRVLADGLLRAGEPGRAADVLHEAQARWPDDEALDMRLARAAAESGRYDQAASTFERLIARHPENVDVLFLAMLAAFDAASDAVPPAFDALHAALVRYRDLYVKANGPRQALVGEWMRYLESRRKGS